MINLLVVSCMLFILVFEEIALPILAFQVDSCLSDYDLGIIYWMILYSQAFHNRSLRELYPEIIFLRNFTNNKINRILLIVSCVCSMFSDNQMAL